MNSGKEKRIRLSTVVICNNVRDSAHRRQKALLCKAMAWKDGDRELFYSLGNSLSVSLNQNLNKSLEGQACKLRMKPVLVTSRVCVIKTFDSSLREKVTKIFTDRRYFLLFADTYIFFRNKKKSERSTMFIICIFIELTRN